MFQPATAAAAIASSSSLGVPALCQGLSLSAPRAPLTAELLAGLCYGVNSSITNLAGSGYGADVLDGVLAAATDFGWLVGDKRRRFSRCGSRENGAVLAFWWTVFYNDG